MNNSPINQTDSLHFFLHNINRNCFIIRLTRSRLQVEHFYRISLIRFCSTLSFPYIIPYYTYIYSFFYLFLNSNWFLLPFIKMHFYRFFFTSSLFSIRSNKINNQLLPGQATPVLGRAFLNFSFNAKPIERILMSLKNPTKNHYSVNSYNNFQFFLFFFFLLIWA